MCIVSNHFKFISENLIKGLLFGIGFVVVALAGSHYIGSVFEKPIRVIIADQEAVDNDSANADFKKDLNIVSHLSLRERRTQNQLQILCKIKNNGDVTWTGIEVQAELFNKGRYVYECEEYVRLLMAGEEDNLKIICGECAMDVIPEYDNIKLKVAAAHRD